MDLDIAPAYAAVLGLGLILLSYRVIRLRRSAGVAIGGGGAPALERAIRVQANFVEYVPLSIILVAFVEIAGNPDWLVHALCGVLLLGRAVHAFGVSQSSENYRYRVFGMAATFAVLGVASIVVLAGGGILTSLFG